VQIEVRFFASLTEIVGRASATCEVAGDAAVQDLWRQLVERHPRLGELSYQPLVACDLDYSGWDRPLAGVREVAFLPPVSGG
jgi:molybdopterin converting factor small subunit